MNAAVSRENRALAVAAAAVAASAVSLLLYARSQRGREQPRSRPKAEAYPTLTSLEQTTMLPSGRLVSWAEYGSSDTSSRTVLYLHGVPGSRIIPVPDLRWLCDVHRVHIIAVDRPGFGHTSPAAADESTFDIAAEDAVAVLRQLGIPRRRHETLEIVGYSMGAPHALSVLRGIPGNLVAAVHLVAPAGFVGAPRAYSGLCFSTWATHALARWGGAWALRARWAMSAARMVHEDAYLASVLASTSDGDRDRLSDDDVELWKTSTREMLRQGTAGLDKAVLETVGKDAPDGWGWDVGKLSAYLTAHHIPVTVYEAAHDSMVASATVRELAGLLGVPAESIKNHGGSTGHLSIIGDMLTELIHEK